jgi:hypothetical protein
MTGKLSWSPFNEGDEQHTPWLSISNVKDTQDTLTKKVERLCILVVLKQQHASNKNKTVCFLAIFLDITRG